MAPTTPAPRQLIAELIELYKSLPCLWDISSEAYKDGRQKKAAWEMMLNKYKDIEPDANEASIKKKMDSLKYGYQREAKKVKESLKRSGSGTEAVHIPNLWYFELMTFLEKKKDTTSNGVECLIIEDDDDRPLAAKKSKFKDLERKREKSLETTHFMSQPETYVKQSETHVKQSETYVKQSETRVNTFAKYVGEKLDNIQGEQKDLAEKLISEVLLYAKLNKLSIESKIYTPTQTTNDKNPYSSHHLPHLLSQPSIPHVPPTHYRLSSPLSQHSPTIQSLQDIQSPPLNHVPRTIPASISVSHHSSTIHSSQTIQSPPPVPQDGERK